jgi:hypothetical protein
MKTITAGLLFAAVAALCHGQTVISAHSGTLHYFEGDVSIDGAAITQKPSHFFEVKEQATLRTGQGRAELLLTPGVFLRVGENSAVRMLDNRLASTRVEVVQGNVMVESMDQQMSLKDSPVTLIYGSYEVHMVKHGLVEIATEPAEVKVFKGETEVTAGDNKAVVKEGRLVPLAAGLVAEKFDVKAADDLYLWARDRSESLSAANMASARRISSSYASGGASTGPWTGGWYFNPYMDMFTYVPAFGMMASPFGFGYFSPAAIYSYYSPIYSFYGAAPSRASAPVSGLVSPVRALASGSAPGGAQLGSPIRSGVSAPGGGFSAGRPSFGGGGLARGGGRAR